MVYVLFIVGFVLLVKGADWLVDAACILARRNGISDLVIGLTLVSFGTSLPELTVNVTASMNGSADIAIGNVLGSNIANILLILGASAMIATLPVQRPTLLSEIPFSLAAALLIGFLANTHFFGAEESVLMINRWEGVFIIFFFFLFMIYIADMAIRDKAAAMNENPDLDYRSPLWQLMLIMGGGIVSLYLGGQWVVDGAVQIAQQLGMSEALIGLTVVAIGTSLPELVTSMVAAWRGNADIAVGNVVGSNIFNLLWVLGLSAAIRPLPFKTISNFDVLAIILASALLIAALAMSRRMVITRPVGILFVLLYAFYTAYLIERG